MKYKTLWTQSKIQRYTYIWTLDHYQIDYEQLITYHKSHQSLHIHCNVTYGATSYLFLIL